MKKKLFLTLLGTIWLCLVLACYYEENADTEIKINNNSSQDLHISFYPNIFTHKDVGVTFQFKDVNVKKGESVSLMVKFRYQETKYGPHNDVYIGPFPNDNIKKIIFSKMDSGELIKEVYNIFEIIKEVDFELYTFEITDELLSTEEE